MSKVFLSQEGGKGKKLVLKLTVKASNIPDGTANVVGLWREDTGKIVGHSEVIKGNKDPEFTTEFHLDHYMTTDLPVKLCVYSAASDPVDAENFVGSHVTTLASLFKKKNQENPLDGCEGATLTTRVAVLADPNQAKKVKKPKVEEGPKLSKAEAAAAKARGKIVSAAVKEGGKKGQDLCGMASFGVHFFCVSVDSPNDEWELMEKCMEGMNKEIDPEADDRKGGALEYGKILFAAGEKKLLIMAHVPTELEGSTVEDFLKAVCGPVDANILSLTDTIGKAELIADPDNDRFPIKLKDIAISAGFAFLRERKLVIDDDDSDDDINFADDCGIDLNGGAEGSDY